MPMQADYQAPATKMVEGVEIFAAGNWTDSQGNQKEWTEKDLDTLLKNFKIDSKEIPIPVKVGHTDDAFNQMVANELGVPSTLLTGDGGMGAARLGTIKNVRKDGSTLVADFQDVPEPITDLIESGMFNAVSVEIDMLEEDDPHFSGVAILGAELPAVSSLASLSTASIFSTAKDSQSWVTLSFQAGEPEQVDPVELAAEFAAISEKMEELIRGKKGARILRAFWSEVKRKMSDMTGKHFAKADPGSLYSWEAIVTQQMKDCTLKLPLELVAQICPDCAGEMGKKGMTALKIQNFELPDNLKVALMQTMGEPDSNFFAKCMDFDLGVKTGEQLGFCAWLMKEYTGEWPSLEGGEIGEHTEATEEDLGSNNPAAREAAEIQSPKFEEATMGEFVLMPEDLPALYEALGLPETATIEDVLAAIEALKAGEAEEPMDGGALPEEMVPMSDGSAERIAALEQELVSLRGYTKELQKEKLVMSYQKQAAAWDSIPGTPEELGAELAELHETAGAAVAQKVALSYQKANEAAVQATQTLGTSRSLDQMTMADKFEEEVEALAQSEGMSFEKALGKMAAKNGVAFQAYRARVRDHVQGGK